MRLTRIFAATSKMNAAMAILVTPPMTGRNLYFNFEGMKNKKGAMFNFHEDGFCSAGEEAVACIHGRA